MNATEDWFSSEHDGVVTTYSHRSSNGTESGSHTSSIGAAAGCASPPDGDDDEEAFVSFARNAVMPSRQFNERSITTTHPKIARVEQKRK